VYDRASDVLPPRENGESVANGDRFIFDRIGEADAIARNTSPSPLFGIKWRQRRHVSRSRNGCVIRWMAQPLEVRASARTVPASRDPSPFSPLPKQWFSASADSRLILKDFLSFDDDVP
jgi:hypothetical protein